METIVMEQKTALKGRTFSLRAGTIVLITICASVFCSGPTAAQTRGVSAVSRPAPHFRPDPMKPWWDTRPKPPSVLTLVNPARVAIAGSAESRSASRSEVRTGARRRLRGSAISGGVCASLDGPSGVDIVRPGQVLDDGFRVEEIGAGSVTLTRVDGNRTFVERIRLSDATSAR